MADFTLPMSNVGIEPTITKCAAMAFCYFHTSALLRQVYCSDSNAVKHCLNAYL